VTAASSVDAFQATPKDAAVVPVTRKPVGVDGGVVSGHGLVTIITAVRGETLAAAS
jgi:hypothetical protein